MENPDDVAAGAANLRKHIENIAVHGVTPVVAINAFPTDHPSEWAVIEEVARGVWRAVGGDDARRGRRQRSASTSPRRCSRRRANEPTTFRPLYPLRGPAAREDRDRGAPGVRRRRRRLHAARGRPAARRTSSGTARAICRSASRRPTCRSRTTPRCSARRPAGGCRSARSAPRPVPASSTRLRGDAHHARAPLAARRHPHRDRRRRGDHRVVMTTGAVTWPCRRSASSGPGRPR